MKAHSLASLLLFASLPPTAHAAVPKPTLIHDVRVFDGEAVLEHQDLLIRDGRVAALSPTGAPPEGVAVQAGQGRTLLPGLIDCHVHVTFSGAPPWALSPPDPEHNLRAHLRAGTTTVFDVAGKTATVRKIARKVDAGELVGPRMLFSGTAMTAPGGYPNAYLARVMPPLLARFFLRGPVDFLVTREHAAKNAAEIAHSGGRFLKLFVAETPAGIPVLSQALVAVAVEEAHARGLLAIAHIDTAENAMLAARAGVDLLVHGVHSDALSEAQAAELAKLGVAVVPTLITFERLHQMQENEAQFNAVERASEDPELLAEFQRARALEFDLEPGLLRWLTAMGENTPDRLVGNLQRMHAAGVPVFVGTDANGSVGSFPGAIHEELALFVAAGLSPITALRAATAAPAAWIEDAELGRIRPGGPADLVLVEGDPTQNIRDSERIVWVMKGGVAVFDAEAGP